MSKNSVNPLFTSVTLLLLLAVFSNGGTAGEYWGDGYKDRDLNLEQKASEVPAPPAAPLRPETQWAENRVEALTPHRQQISLDGLWNLSYANGKRGRWQKMQVPGGWDGYEKHSSAWYARTVNIPESWQGSAIVLEMDQVVTEAFVFANGKLCGWIPEFFGWVDITKAVTPGQEARIMIYVAKCNNKGGYCGLTESVRLVSRPSGAHISDIWVKPSTRKQQVTLDVEIRNSSNSGTVSFQAEMLNEKNEVEKTFHAKADVKADDAQTVSLAFDWPDPRLWDIGKPELYTLRLTAKGPGFEDGYLQPFGFREFWIDGRKLFLNGNEIRLRACRGDTFDGFQRSYGEVEKIADSIDRAMNMGFTFAELWPHEPWPSPQQVMATVADRKGFAIAAIQERGKEVGKNWSDPKVREVFQQRVNRTARRMRNHPSVLLWNSLGVPTMCNQYPREIGRQSHHMENLEETKKAHVLPILKIQREADPTRPVMWHSYVYGDLTSSNTYLNFTPLQEREEWISDWAENGEVPWLVVEFGMPNSLSFRRGRSFDFSHPLHAEPFMTEYAAIYLGKDAYLDATEREWMFPSDGWNKTGERIRSAQPKSFHIAGITWHRNIPELDPAFVVLQDFQELFWRNTFRSWRTWGLTTLPIPWTDAVPGPGKKPTRLQKALRAVNSDTLAWICGPRKAFTAKDHSYWTGETMEKSVALLNDSRAPLPYAITWSVTVDEKKIAFKSVQGTLGISETEFVPVVAVMPKELGGLKVEGQIVLTGTIGDFTHNDSFDFRVFKKPAPEAGTITVFDPAGKTSSLLRALGYQTQAWDGTVTKELVVIGREALKEPLPGSLKALVENGGRVLVMAQKPEWIEENLGFRTAKHLSRRVFKVDQSHPVGEHLDELDLSDWRGESTLVSAYPKFPEEYKQKADFGFPKYGFRWGNRGALCSGAIEKPHLVGWRAILECEFDMAYTPLMELDYGGGRMIWCSLDLEDYVPRDPVATVLAVQLLRYAAQAPLKPKLQTATAIGLTGGQEALLNSMGLAFKKNTQLPQEAGLAILGSDSRLDKELFEKWIARGGRAFLLRSEKQCESLGATFVDVKETGTPNSLIEMEFWKKGGWDFPPSSRAGKDVILPPWPELTGISMADLHRRGPMDHRAISGGVETASNGLLGRTSIGKGVALMCMVSPRQIDTEKQPYLRLTRWRQTRLIAQLLANLGARFAADSAACEMQDPGKSGIGYYHKDYRTDHYLGDNPYRYWRW